MKTRIPSRSYAQTDRLDIDTVEVGGLAKVGTPQSKAAAAVYADLKDVHLLSPEAGEVAVVNLEVVAPLPQTWPLGVSIEVLLKLCLPGSVGVSAAGVLEPSPELVTAPESGERLGRLTPAHCELLRPSEMPSDVHRTTFSDRPTLRIRAETRDVRGLLDPP